MRAAVWQATTGTDPLLGARALVETVEAAAAAGADMLFTPEMSAVLDRDRARAAHAIVDEADDVALAAVREAAAKAGLWVHLGSLAVRAEDGRLANRAFVIDAAGAIRARYDKLHLFDATVADGQVYRESDSYRPGTVAVAVDTPWFRLGLAICYDLRFPALFSALSDAGATVLAIPAAFTVPTGRDHWEVLLRARAIENGAFVVAAAQSGTHADGRATWGRSMVVDPWGGVRLDMGAAPGLSIVDMDGEMVASARARVPVLAHRRPIGDVALAS